MTTVPATYPARGAHVQNKMYFRKTVNFSDANVATGIKFGRLPAGAFITRAQVEVSTVFNAATTNVLTFGTTLANANEIVNAADINEAAIGVTDVTRALGTSLTGGPGSGLTVTSEVDLYAKYTQTGTAATTGVATLILEFATNNDQ